MNSATLESETIKGQFSQAASICSKEIPFERKYQWLLHRVFSCFSHYFPVMNSDDQLRFDCLATHRQSRTQEISAVQNLQLLTCGAILSMIIKTFAVFGLFAVLSPLELVCPSLVIANRATTVTLLMHGCKRGTQYLGFKHLTYHNKIMDYKISISCYEIISLTSHKNNTDP